MQLRIALVVVLLLVAAVAALEPKVCNTDCPPAVASTPKVCGSDGTRRILFNNYCALQAYNCVTGRNFRFFRLNNCY